MTENEAFHAVGLLIGGVKTWPEAATDGFVTTFVKHADDAPAMVEVCQRIALSWGEQFGHPTIKQVMDEYRKHPRVAAAREASTAAAMLRTVGATHCTGSRWVEIKQNDEGRFRPCPRCNPILSDVFDDPERWARWLTGGAVAAAAADGDGSLPPACKVDTRYEPDPIMDFADGRAVAGDRYRLAYGRELGSAPTANPEFAETLIRDEDRYDAQRDVWYSTYAAVARGFRGDHARAGASLRAIGRRLTHDSLGRLTLRPPDEPVIPVQPAGQPSAPQGAEQPPPPSERPPDPSGLLSEAIGITRRRMEGDQ